MKNKPAKTEEHFKKCLMSLIDRWVPVLFLQRHTFEVKLKEEEGDDGYFACEFKYPYLNARIIYSKKAMEDWGKGTDMTPFVLHELCHLVTDPFYAKAVSRYVTKDCMEDERERLTDLICNIVLNKS